MTTVGLDRTTRDTLTTLRLAKEQAAVAGQRIATGKRINQPLEDPTVYFNALSLSSKAAEMDRTLEQVGQGVQVIKAADAGLSSIGDLIETLRSVVDQAKRSDDAFRRSELATEFNDMLRKIEEVASDSGYRGRNLLGGPGNDLKLYFGVERTDAVRVEPVDYTDVAIALGLVDIQPGVAGYRELALVDAGNVALSENDPLSASPDFPVPTTITAAFAGPPAATKSLEVTAETKVRDLVKLFHDPDRGVRTSMKADGTLKIEALSQVTIDGGPFGPALTPTVVSPVAAGDWTARFTVDFSPADNPIEITSESVRAAREQLRAQAATFGTSLTLVQNRETFMSDFARTLLAGAEEFVAADTNAEAANLLSLQLRQQLSTNALSLGNEADQGVLRLLGG